MTFQRLENLRGKVAVITGAGGQVGYATALRLAEAGCQVVGISRSKIDELEKLFEELPNRELGHYSIQADITNTDSIKTAVDQVKTKSGKVDILINSAGVSSNIRPNNINQLTDELFDKIIITNLRGTYAMIREFYSLLNETGDGLIVNISSTSAQKGGNSNVAYAASKSGIDIMTRTLSKVLSPRIRIVSVVPGHMEKATSGIKKDPAINEKLAEMCPLKRIGYGDDIASTIEALCTHIRFSTGSIFIVDGGRSA
jgi:NAD(P)-dependent dehydrogenase (short-subunit alcohol dehydrogenase family)